MKNTPPDTRINKEKNSYKLDFSESSITAKEDINNRLEHLAAIVESSEDAIYSITFDGTILSWNKAAERIYGYAAKNIIGQNVSILFPPEILHKEIKVLEQIKSGKRIKNYETFRIGKNGSSIPISLTASPVKNESGKIIAISKTARDITARKQAEEKLRESEEKLRIFIEHAPAAMAMLDRELRYLAVSRRWMSDYELKGNIIGCCHYEIFPDLPERWKKVNLEALAGAVKKSNEDQYRHADGTIHWLNWEVHPWFDGAGNICGIIIFTEDITERKRTESIMLKDYELIRNQLSEIESLYQNAPVGFGFVDVNLRYVRLNERLAEINGAPVSKHIGHTINEILPENLGRRLEVLFRKILETGEPVLNSEITGETAAQPGVQRHWIGSYYPLKNAFGETMGIHIVLMEITESRRAEEKAHHNERRLHGLLINLFSFVVMLETNGTLMEVSNAALAASDLKPDHAIGKHLSESYWWAWSKESREKLHWAIALAAKGEMVRYDAIIRTGENQFSPIDVHLAPIFDENKTVIQLVLSAIDNSERVRLEAKLVQMAQLSFAGEIAAGLAHEIKNPLSGIQGAVDILLRSNNKSGFEQRLLEDLRREIARIDDVLHSLLNRARPHSLIFTQASVGETLRRAVRLARFQIAVRKLEDQISVELVLPAETIIANHDVAQLEDAVLNLIINALDALGNDKNGRIRVRLFKSSQGGEKNDAVIEVTDNGAGIPEEHLANLFTPFYSTKETGTGLGLTAVQRIVTAHGGYCTVKSTVGQGTIFTIRLPL